MDGRQKARVLGTPFTDRPEGVFVFRGRLLSLDLDLSHRFTMTHHGPTDHQVNHRILHTPHV